MHGSSHPCDVSSSMSTSSCALMPPAMLVLGKLSCDQVGGAGGLCFKAWYIRLITVSHSGFQIIGSKNGLPSDMSSRIFR